MPVIPTDTDITFAAILTHRVLLRRNFETLRDRANAKYFKSVVINDIPWGVKTGCPKNVPAEFLERHPFDFEVRFTTLGCNKLKCYKNDYSQPCRGRDPFVINGYVYACHEACFGVQEEFDEFLTEKFTLQEINTRDKSELFFETMSFQSGDHSFCGIQLTGLKTYAIFPSSRWVVENEDDRHLSVTEYAEKYKSDAWKMRDMAGLVDAPPLLWNTADQDVNFTRQYCSRFKKAYDAVNDACYTRGHRQVINFILGENFTQQFSNQDMLRFMSGLPPIDLITSRLQKPHLSVNPEYSERTITQEKLQRDTFTSQADKTLGDDDVINQLNVSSALPASLDVVTHRWEEVDNYFYDLLQSMAEETITETAIVQSTAAMSRLLKFISRSAIHRAILTRATSSKAFSLPLVTRLSCLVVKGVMNKMLLRVAVKILATTSSAVSVIFAVGLVTVIPDLLLSIYNVGGYNNEITRQDVETRKKSAIEAILRSLIEDYRTSISYFTVYNRNKDTKIISPFITPEFLYNLCLINFITKNPDQNTDIGFDGIDSEQHYDMMEQYLLDMKINSAGQYIELEDKDKQNDVITLEQKKSYKATPTTFTGNRINYVIASNKDLYLLTLGLLLTVMAIFFFMFYKKLIGIFLCVMSVTCFTFWYKWIEPAIY